MSKINKTVLAMAVAVAMVPSIAFAAKVTVGANHMQAYEVTNLTSGVNPTAALNDTFSYNLEAGDILIGRTTGNINVRVTLSGANFDSTGPVPTVVVNPAQGTIVGAPVVANNVLSFVVAPINTGMGAGSLFTITAPSLAVESATALQSLGGNVVASVDVRDTSTGITLQTAVNGAILTAFQSSGVAFSAASSATADVVQGKKKFLIAGAAVDATNLKLGTVTADDQVSGTITAQAQGAGAAFADNDDGNGNFQFDVNGVASVPASNRDRLYAEVNFANTNGVSQVYLSTLACATGTGTIVNSAGITAVLAKTGNQYAGSIDLGSTGANTFNICARFDGTTAISSQTITAASKIDYLVGRDTTLSATSTISNIVYNGSSVDVMHVNPGSNANQVSYIRISNPTSTTGLVTITGVCDNGIAGVQPATLMLNGGQSVQLTAAQIEDGGAGGITAGQGIGRPGTCTGKWRLNVTGEFSPMYVQNFLKNRLGSGEVNTNVNDNN